MTHFPLPNIYFGFTYKIYFCQAAAQRIYQNNATLSGNFERKVQCKTDKKKGRRERESAKLSVCQHQKKKKRLMMTVCFQYIIDEHRIEKHV